PVLCAASSCAPPAPAAHHYICSLRVQSADELFVDRQADVFALRDILNTAAELFGIELQPSRHAASRRRFDGLADLIVLAALLANLNNIALLHLIGGDVDFLSVHLGVSVGIELTSLRSRR